MEYGEVRFEEKNVEVGFCVVQLFSRTLGILWLGALVWFSLFPMHHAYGEWMKLMH
jgi:hypothetical protein